MLVILLFGVLKHAHFFINTIINSIIATKQSCACRGKETKTKETGLENTLLFNQLSSNNNKPSTSLVHGFGCSTTYWRKTTTTLVNEGHEVHSIDLLGQGKSAKPGRDDGVEHSIDLWAVLVESHAKEKLKKVTWCYQAVV